MSKSSVVDCGLGPCWRPKWLLPYATPRSFLVVYGLLGTTQTMAFIYFIATLTTLEKRFKIPSKTTGIVMSGNEISQILLSLSLSYYGGRGNRPLWIAWGVALSGISCFILALPHLIYGAGQDALALTEEHIHDVAVALVNTTLGHGVDADASLCSHDRQAADEVCTADEYSLAPVIIVFISQFVLGIGTTLFFALGQPYLDDNTKKTKTPMLLGFVLALRSIGPVLGFVLGFSMLSVYIDPSLTPLITKQDPRWLGAWWIGWIVLGVTMLLFSLLIAMFPQRLPPKAIAKKTSIVRDPMRPLQGQLIESQSWRDEQTKYLFDDFQSSTAAVEDEEDTVEYQQIVPAPKGDFKTALIRLLRNKLLMLNSISGVFYILGASGYITFLTKYMETQFQQSAAGANIIGGTAGILAMVIGFLLSGVVISKFQPTPRKLLAWNVFVGCGYVVGEIAFIFLGCPDNGLQGVMMPNGSLNLQSICNEGCHCDYMKYTPVCNADQGETFYSPCHAGCSTILDLNNTLSYSNCSCATGSSLNKDMSAGPCFVDCGSSFMWFLIISCVMHALGSSGKIGNILVNYRSVIPEDKPFSQGLGLLMISLFAFIPGPIIYGAIIDSTCLVWNNSCGERGNCWLYHKEDFRYYLNATAVVFTTLGVIFDIAVWYLGKHLNLYNEPEDIAMKS